MIAFNPTQLQAQSVDALILKSNEARKANNLKELKPNLALGISAKNKACDLYEKKYWSHTDQANRPFYWWIQQAGYKKLILGENLAVDYENDEQIIKAWLNSQSHRANILSSKYTEIGIGRCGNYVVQHFGG